MLDRIRRDDGFTLVELLISIVILAVITVPLSNAVIGILHNQQETEDRLALSQDAQIAGSYFAQDVAAIGVRGDLDATDGMHFSSVWSDAAYDAGAQTCGPAGVTQEVRLMSDNWDAPDAVSIHVVAYVRTNTTQLHRIKCVNSVQVSDVVVARNLDPTIEPTVTCTFDYTPATPTCESAPPPRQVKLTFTLDLGSADPYPITLIGERRQS
ncbi:prepilin-type N-terminal cleavage/methylation domain-containing protein [Actinophytocola sp.]|uniref:prepilin-type N-terminal cleavage/methylation domain-containing protein n=1 Tax=Actinophytocola sp. TaxID=1872138 RepID=UPI002ED13560